MKRDRIFLAVVIVVGVLAAAGIVGYVVSSYLKTNPLDDEKKKIVDPVTTLAVSVQKASESVKNELSPTPSPVVEVTPTPGEKESRIILTPPKVTEPKGEVIDYNLTLKGWESGRLKLRDSTGNAVYCVLLGVEVPYSIGPKGSDHTDPNYRTVKDLIKGAFNGKRVYLEDDAQRFNGSGYECVYAFFENGVMLQDWLLINGLAKAVPDGRNSKYDEHFAELERQAKERRAGLWEWGE